MVTPIVDAMTTFRVRSSKCLTKFGTMVCTFVRIEEAKELELKLHHYMKLCHSMRNCHNCGNPGCVTSYMPSLDSKPCGAWLPKEGTL